MPFQRQFWRQQSSKRAERMKKHVGEKRVRANNACLDSSENSSHGRGVFDGIELTFPFNRLLDALVLFHSNCLDPSHAPSPPKNPSNNYRDPPPVFATAPAFALVSSVVRRAAALYAVATLFGVPVSSATETCS